MRLPGLPKKTKIPKPAVRTLEQMKPVLYSPNITRPKRVYFMYRGIASNKKYKLRYDITVIPSARLEKEHAKTFGHYHAVIPGSKHTYPEIYEVLAGEAYYLLQKKNGKEVVLVKAKKGEQVIVPSDYGHVTINPGKRTLVMANIVSSRFKSDYKEFKEKKGGMYYYLTNKKLVKNDNYKSAPKIKIRRAKKKKSLYQTFIKNPSHFKFLNK